MKINKSIREKVSRTFKENGPDILATVGVLGLNTSKEFVEFVERKGIKVYVVVEVNTYEEWWEVSKVFLNKDTAYKYANYEKNDCAGPCCFSGYHVYEMELE